MKTFSLYTIGYSAFEPVNLIRLLNERSIGAVADVRSTPYSSRFREYNREQLQALLRRNRIHYLYLGKELGARPDKPELYSNGRADFRKMAATESFREACQRIRNGLSKMSICLLCAEKDPIQCHRTVLICHNFLKLYPAANISHILADGGIESQEQTDLRIMRKHDLLREHLLMDFEQRMEEAYRKQEEEVAYRLEAKSDQNVYE